MINLPEKGKIVIIDDKYEQIETLISVFTKKGLSVIYLNGQMDTLPEKPIDDIRLLFLDIELTTGSVSDKNKVAKVIKILKKVVGSKTFPYVIVAWTRHEDLFEDVKLKAIEKDIVKPIKWLNMEKGQCQDGDGDFDFAVVSDKLKKELQKSGIFELFVLWENLVGGAANSIINDFCSFYDYDEKWNDHLSGIIYKLAEAYSGKQLNLNDHSEILKDSLLAFNGAFIDILENNIKNGQYSNIQLVNDCKPDKKILSEINSKLHFVFEKSNKVQPGNIYKKKITLGRFTENLYDFFAKDKRYKFLNKIIINHNEQYNKNDDIPYLLFKEKCSQYYSDLKKDFLLIDLEASPSCDYAQNKWTNSRLLPGLMIPDKFSKFIRNHTDYLYCSSTFCFDQKQFVFVFDFRKLHSISLSEIQGKKKVSIFRIRHDLLIDIQSSLSKHINRPGILSV
ncbi:MAG: hypothetical protein GY754_01015 [bacterium]|nr:hypothetical protein [bacterium]